MPMTVLSYNIQDGGVGRLPLLAAVIARRQPDAVALLEATSRDNAASLARALGMHLTFGEANGVYHIAWLSRRPPTRATNHRLPSLAKTLLEIEIAADGATLRLFATHLASRHDATTPAEEIALILAVLRPLAGQPHALVGDLNALRSGDPIGTPPPAVEKRGEAVAGAPRPTIQRLIDAGYVDCYRARHPRANGYTYPAHAPWLRLDYIYAAPPLAPCLRACAVVAGADTARASDHLPIWATFGSPAARPQQAATPPL